MKDLLYELVIQDESDEIYAISLVSEPAIELDFVYFDKEEIRFSTVNEEQRIVMGPILVPDKKILRVDGEGKPYYVFLKAETIKKLAQKYLQNKYQSEVTIEHNGERVDDVTLIESWITESRTKDKSAVYGLSVPVGTWMGAMKISDDTIWNDYVKTGKVNGFSIEGLFSHQLVEASVTDLWDKDIETLTDDEAEVVLKKIKALIKDDKRYKVKRRIDMESYSDYPDGVRGNAKRAVEWANKNGWGSCGTAVGKLRASQLSKGEPISVDTIKRMYSFLSRHEGDLESSKSYGDGCGKLMYDAWGGRAALGWSRNKLRELGLLNEQAQPSIPGSSYAGEPVSGSRIPPVLQDFAECPEATQNIALNLHNRSVAIKQAHYGPLNPNEPNESYWEAKASQFEGDVDSAKKALCGNCAFFDIKQKTLECIAEGIGGEDAWDSIEAGKLGYCEAFDFKCAAARTCDAWVTGGPVTD